MAFLFRQGDNNERGVYTNADIANGNWHHIVVVANQASNTATIYVDGISQAITTGL